jgi:hypothetical protein
VAELGMTILCCLATPVSVGITVLLSNIIIPFAVVEILTSFCGVQ